MSKGEVMKWVVKSTLLCPQTGTAFSTILSLENWQLIIWYSAKKILTTGDIISPFSNGLIVNKRYYEFQIYKIQPHTRQWWVLLQNTLSCPGNKPIKPTYCNYAGVCLFEHCPYNLKPFDKT